MQVVVLHPGEMGSAVARAISDPVFWISNGRSEATARRAREAGMTAVEDPRAADVILSICPPVRRRRDHRSAPAHRGHDTALPQRRASARDRTAVRGRVLEARIVPDASALKMVYAAWTKGSAALLLAARATAAAGQPEGFHRAAAEVYRGATRNGG
jgi:hypothetical protein